MDEAYLVHQRHALVACFHQVHLHTFIIHKHISRWHSFVEDLVRTHECGHGHVVQWHAEHHDANTDETGDTCTRMGSEALEASRELFVPRSL